MFGTKVINVVAFNQVNILQYVCYIHWLCALYCIYKVWSSNQEVREYVIFMIAF